MLIGCLVELCGEFHHRLLRVQFFRLFCELKALLGMPPILLRGWHKLGEAQRKTVTAQARLRVGSRCYRAEVCPLIAQNAQAARE
jgi:hypothetical protein